MSGACCGYGFEKYELQLADQLLLFPLRLVAHEVDRDRRFDVEVDRVVPAPRGNRFEEIAREVAFGLDDTDTLVVLNVFERQPENEGAFPVARLARHANMHRAVSVPDF